MTAPPPPFAPLPVRARGTLEILDTGLKLFRRYFVVLVGWSLIVTALCGLPLLAISNDEAAWALPILGLFLYFFLMPFIFGAVSCVVAAAVRGQTVQFMQVWKFTRPRYSALLGVQFVGGIVLFMLLIASTIVTSLVFGVGGMVVNSTFPILREIATWTLAILSSTVSSLVSCIGLGWFNMSAIIACLEDNNRGAASLGRASALMAGNIKRVTGVCATLAIFLSIVSIVFFVLFFAFAALWLSNTNSSNFDWHSMFEMVTAYVLYFGLMLALWFPAQGVITAVLYLDLRVKKEALDLEWTNYATAPEVTDGSQEARENSGAVAPQERPLDAQPSLQPSSLASGGSLPTPHQEFDSPSSFGAGLGATPAPMSVAPTLPTSPPPSPSSSFAPVEQPPAVTPTAPVVPEPMFSEGVSSFASTPSSFAPNVAQDNSPLTGQQNTGPQIEPAIASPMPGTIPPASTEYQTSNPVNSQVSPQAGESHVNFEPLSPLDSPAPDAPRL